jgi:hypothetical protein
VSEGDPRLGRFVRALDHDATTAREAAERAVQRRCSPEQQRLLVLAMTALTVEGARLRRLPLDEELRGIVGAVLDSDRSRTVALARLGLDGAPAVTLEQAGRAAGVTRERVRQIEKRFRNGIAPAERVWTPALDKVLQVIRHTSPTTGQRLHKSLTERGLIPENFSTESILAAADVFAKRIEIYAEHGLISSRPLPVTPERVAATALRLVTHWGATTVQEVCARFAEEASLAVSPELARLLLESLEDFCWLDQRHGWFWLRPTARNRLLNQVEKIMSVAPSVSIADLRVGVGRHHRMEGLRLPRHVLGRLCQDSGLYERDDDQILRKPGHPDWKDRLGKTEAILVEVLLDHGSVMSRDELERTAVQERGLSRSSFYLHLGSSPVLACYEPGVYGLRGSQPSRTPATGSRRCR